ncbi:MerR family transcriptional regulator [Kitasatospora sp. NPDC087271]|uniref:MerR family transcriptional regulator n=1 Tax=Kitasatospora sp. NPDC087271 TaxID=3364067 RepID=UPI00380B0760
MPLLDEMLGIGELARLTAVPVWTIRFYCDEGIVDSVRSTGGHGRFDRVVVERLGLVRRLRRLGLGQPRTLRPSWRRRGVLIAAPGPSG